MKLGLEPGIPQILFIQFFNDPQYIGSLIVFAEFLPEQRMDADGQPEIGIAVEKNESRRMLHFNATSPQGLLHPVVEFS